jgi:iron-sulfur cluster assembly protein
MVTISEEAKLKVLDLLREDNKDPNVFNIRVGVKGGGCSGLS